MPWILKDKGEPATQRASRLGQSTLEEGRCIWHFKQRENIEERPRSGKLWVNPKWFSINGGEYVREGWVEGKHGQVAIKIIAAIY